MKPGDCSPSRSPPTGSGAAAAAGPGDSSLDSSSPLWEDNPKDLEGQESDLESKLMVCEEEISNLSRSKCGSIDLDSLLIDHTNKLNLLKRELATKLRAMLSLKCQLEDVPVQTELIQYERRFSELYAQIQEKHHLTRKHYATYNALLEIKELMLKEASLLNSIDLQFKDAIATPSGRTKLLNSMEVIVEGAKHKISLIKKVVSKAPTGSSSAMEKKKEIVKTVGTATPKPKMPLSKALEMTDKVVHGIVKSSAMVEKAAMERAQLATKVSPAKRAKVDVSGPLPEAKAQKYLAAYVQCAPFRWFAVAS